MKTLKTTLLISMLLILTTSCTDLTDNLVPETKIENTELNSGTNDITNDDTVDTTNNLDTGDGDNSGDGGKGN
jgi:hypothetical protein